jgi:hypothetical protein
MISSWIVEFKTGYELRDGELERIRERIAEELQELAAEHMADMHVRQSHFTPGPASVEAGLVDRSRPA